MDYNYGFYNRALAYLFRLFLKEEKEEKEEQEQ
jgi:hypothetical protein